MPLIFIDDDNLLVDNNNGDLLAINNNVDLPVVVGNDNGEHPFPGRTILSVYGRIL
jgi:hypothetical protein